MDIWDHYHSGFERIENEGKIRRPIVPKNCLHNAHMYYLLLPDLESRSHLIAKLKELKIGAVFHYVPLHSSPAGVGYSRVSGELPVTDQLSERLVRLPMWCGLEKYQKTVIDAVIGIVQ